MKPSEKVIVKLLKMKKRDKGMSEIINGGYLDEVINDHTSLRKSKKPKTKKNYVGVEIECFSSCERHDLYLDLYEANLTEKVSVGSDGSVRPNSVSQLPYEIRLIDTERGIANSLRKLMKILDKRDFRVNDTCGLHVHLDCRNRDKDAVYNRLLRSQILLYGLVGKNRLDNQFCRYSSSTTRYDKYRAINYATGGKRTVEVRLHHATMNVDDIINWINLLVKVANAKTSSVQLRNPKNASQELKLGTKLKQYLNKTYVDRARGVDYDASPTITTPASLRTTTLWNDEDDYDL